MITQLEQVPEGVGKVYQAKNFSIEEVISTLLSDDFKEDHQLIIPDPRNKTPSNPINYKMPLVKDGKAMKNRSQWSTYRLRFW